LDQVITGRNLHPSSPAGWRKAVRGVLVWEVSNGTLSYPNGQSTVYNYSGVSGDERLQEIKNETPASAVLSQNDYTYAADNKIATWQQQTDSNTPLLWTEGYDAADQLTSAVLTNTTISSPAVRSDSYGYDAAGNATTFNVSGVSRSPSYNALNQLTGSTPGGTRTVGFTGALNEAVTLTINGSAATVNSSRAFSGTASLTTASTNAVFTVPVVATDAQGNVRTNHYSTVVPAELTYSPTFDVDGNELTNGAGQTYTWDAKNELMSIVYTAGSNSGNHTEFAYDAVGRRISIVERTGTTVGSGTVTSTKQHVWNGGTIAEERNVSNAVTKNFYAQGERIGGTSYYYTRDHLGSVREMTDSSGNIQARYDYDPYGRVSQIQGTLASDFQYAGYYTHQTSGLDLTLFRAYDPNTAKWLSRDPLGEGIGPNLYAYVWNYPVGLTDPLGLCPPDFKTGSPNIRPVPPPDPIATNGPQIPPPTTPPPYPYAPPPPPNPEDPAPPDPNNPTPPPNNGPTTGTTPPSPIFVIPIGPK
jgi:RHS repeat-associated protein